MAVINGEIIADRLFRSMGCCGLTKLLLIKLNDHFHVLILY